MGWLKRKKNKWKQKCKDASLKRALAAYIVLGTIGTLLVIMLIQFFCSMIDTNIWDQYILEYDDYGWESSYYAPFQELQAADRSVLQITSFMETWSPFFCIIGGVMAVTVLFYKNKLKEPLGILAESAKRIGNDDLDFCCAYETGDEMGQLCRSFETMRVRLLENHQKMWDMMEEQKRLNHAFAHDLRTPLTVLHGYIDFLTKYHPEGSISEEKLLETLNLMDKQVIRLRRFGDTMKSVGTLGERKIEKKSHTGRHVGSILREMADSLSGTGGVMIWMESRIPPEREFWLDEAIFCEVLENILSNSLRYAKQWVQLIAEETGGFLEIHVRDDGPGFDEEGLHMAARPYYKDKNENTSEHFGIGLYICHVLCEKHGGTLALHNSVDGGAIISASFRVAAPDIEKK